MKLQLKKQNRRENWLFLMNTPKNFKTTPAKAQSVLNNRIIPMSSAKQALRILPNFILPSGVEVGTRESKTQLIYVSMSSKRRETLAMQNAHVRYVHRLLKQYGLDAFPKSRLHCSPQSLAKSSQTKEHNKPFQPLPLSGPESPAGPEPAAAQRELEAPIRSPLAALPCQQPQIGSAERKALQQHVGKAGGSRSLSAAEQDPADVGASLAALRNSKRCKSWNASVIHSRSIINLTENCSLKEQVKG